VRPNFIDADNNEIAGTWTEASFMTSMPAVQITAPGSWKEVYPWPVNFKWKPVKGAENFIFEIKLARAGWGDPDGEEKSITLPASQTAHKLNLRGDDYEILYGWRVRVVGPRIESLALSEQGLPDARYFKVMGAWTIPKPLTVGPNLCVELDSQVKLAWQTVPEASMYEVSVFEGLCPKNATCQQGERLQTVGFQAQPSSTQSCTYIPKPMAHTDAVGLRYAVRSFGPEHVPGMQSSPSRPLILVQPTKPELLAPMDMAEFETDDSVELRWQSGMAHWGGFVVNVYKGSNSQCQGLPQLSFVCMGSSAGVTSASLSNLQLDSGTHNHSWRVKPFVAGLDYQNQHYEPCQRPKWSDCNRFVVKEATPNLTKPWVPTEESSFYGSILAYWKKVPGADSYTVEIRIGSKNGPLFINPPTNWSVSELAAHKAEWDQLLLDWFGEPSNPSLWIAKIDGVVPINVYYWKVKACKGGNCGPESDWSKWTEIPNPYP
jgi:hypothetical protein